jgi:hypothetical protein
MHNSPLLSNRIINGKVVFNTYLLKNGKKTTSGTYHEGKYACKFCSSDEVTFHQHVDDAMCSECSAWQNCN